MKLIKWRFYGILFLMAMACLNLHAAVRNKVQKGQIHHSYVSEKVWKDIEPYLMPENHPLKKKLDSIFSKSRVLSNQETLFQAGFERKNPEPHTRVIVTRHKEMPGYMFKIYLDDKLSYYRDEPEYVTWKLRARGAKLMREEIAALGWQGTFKAPRKWIYALPPTPIAKKGNLQKNFILVEDEMDILPNSVSWRKWQDGTATPQLLDMLFYLITRMGLRGGCKYDNIPFCHDGRIAFIDTQNNLKWPLPYERLFQVLEGDLRTHWENLIKNEANVPRTNKKK